MKHDGTFQRTDGARDAGGVSIQLALLLLIATVLVAALVPAGIALDRRLALSLDERARSDLALAPRILMDRNQSRADMLMMHAKDLAATPALDAALGSDADSAALRLARAGKGSSAGELIVVTSTGRVLSGPAIDPRLLDSTRAGLLPVRVVAAGQDTLRRVALAPVRRGGTWVGAVGLAVPLDASEADALAALTRSSVAVLGPRGNLVATTLGDSVAPALVRGMKSQLRDGKVHDVLVNGRRWIAVTAPIADVADVIFARDLQRELAVVPELRRVAAMIGAAALLLSLALAALVAVRFGRPVRMLADAADRLALGDTAAPLAPTRVLELQRVSHAFDTMRHSLAARMAELERANQELADRQERLAALQAELIRRDRVAAIGQLVAQLAHEIRNPVASVRNLLELLRRRLADDARGRELSELAIDELLRMHDLAEQMLTLHRPAATARASCDAAQVAREVGHLAALASPGDEMRVIVSGAASAPAALAPDALKQVLVNLVQNAREAMEEKGTVSIDVRTIGDRVIIDVVDDGPGIPVGLLARIFDPFFTTKGAVQGVGLGLFIAEGVVRSAGGRISAANRVGAPGAAFRIDLPTAERDGEAEETRGVTSTAAEGIR